MGTVSRVDAAYRWLFIKCDAFRSDLFAHRKEVLLCDVSEDLLGKKVSFELHHSDRGPCAVNVVLED